MMNDFVVRPAVPGEGLPISRIYARTENVRMAERNVLGMSGAAEWIESLISDSSLPVDYTFWVALNNDRVVVGFVQLRMGLRNSFINNIYVSPESQGLGLGRALLGQSIAGSDLSGMLTLDANLENEFAWAWYERLGFSKQGYARWFELPLPELDRATFVLHGLPMARLSYREFGFSLLQVETSSCTYDLGMLGTNWFRLTDPSALDSPGLVSALRSLDPQRRILILREAGTGKTDVQPLWTTVRLVASADTVRLRLSEVGDAQRLYLNHARGCGSDAPQ